MPPIRKITPYTAHATGKEVHELIKSLAPHGVQNVEQAKDVLREAFSRGYPLEFALGIGDQVLRYCVLAFARRHHIRTNVFHDVNPRVILLLFLQTALAGKYKQQLDELRSLRNFFTEENIEQLARETGRFSEIQRAHSLRRRQSTERSLARA
ncbi:MAG: hypothetical protein HYV45_03860 [Candidatus Moranbacteria bacterium]|nr:hypothetical protein [Candidatus Moranbacteria bacterium]